MSRYPAQADCPECRGEGMVPKRHPLYGSALCPCESVDVCCPRCDGRKVLDTDAIQRIRDAAEGDAEIQALCDRAVYQWDAAAWDEAVSYDVGDFEEA